MGSVTGLFGFGGGQQGTGVAAPTLASVVDPTNSGQISSAYTGTQNSMASQQALLQALQGQNGLGNQSQVYNQLQGVVNGTGPNPAQAQLAQATGQNVANQAALMAGQRGAARNVGLMARQAAQQGAATQEQAAGQAATLQANQSLNAINSAGSIANTQAANQIGQVNANAASQQAEQNALLNAQASANTANVGAQNSVNAANAGLANTTLQGQQELLGGAMNGAAAGAKGLSSAAGANGGMVPQMAQGGPVDQSAFQGPQSKFGKFLTSMSTNAQSQLDNAKPTTAGGQLQQGAGQLTSALMGLSSSPAQSTAPTMQAANGGQVPVLLSPGEKYLSPKKVEEVKRGANPMKVGETVPGKPKVGGAKNSYANDFIPKKAEAGGIVVPRSETKSKNPDKNSADFVMKTLAKRRVGK